MYLCSVTAEYKQVLQCSEWKRDFLVSDNGVSASHTRAVRKVSVHFEYLENQSLGLDVTWQPVRGDLTVLF
jgi:hypothetical protein